MEEETGSQQDRLYSLFESNSLSELKEVLAEMHEADITAFLQILGEEDRLRILTFLEPSKIGAVLYEMDSATTKELLKAMSVESISRIIEAIHPDEAADILAYLKPSRAVRILNSIPREYAGMLKEILNYPIDSAGGIMTPEVVRIKENYTVEQAIRECKKSYPADVPLYIYAIDDEGRLTGTVRSRNLLFADDNDKVFEVMNRDAVSININADQEEAANLLQRYDLLALPVVDDDNVLKGVITSDDLFDVVQEENTEDMLLMAGTSEKEPFTEPLFKKALRRIPWLIMTLFGGLIAGTILKSFQETLNEIVALAFFIPVVIGLAGNVGIQSSTIMVRGLATGELVLKTSFLYILREIRVGLMLGFLCGILAGLGGAFISGSFKVGLVVTLSMFTSILFASSNGVMIPLICEKIGIDPAITSGPFVTTFNDIVGILIYLFIGTMLFRMG